MRKNRFKREQTEIFERRKQTRKQIPEPLILSKLEEDEKIKAEQREDAQTNNLRKSRTYLIREFKTLENRLKTDKKNKQIPSATDVARFDELRQLFKLNGGKKYKGKTNKFRKIKY